MAAVAAALWLVYGLGFVGYDSVYALIWGRQLSHGQLPDFFEADRQPDPASAADAVTTVLAPLGDRALPALAVLSLVAFAALGWGAFRLGRELFSLPTGIAFAVILLTRDLLVAGVYQALEEIPFLALVIWSIVLEAERRRRGAPVLVLLGLAGLLRPEAWLLSAAYLVYLLPPLASGQRVRMIALAAAAPLLWALSDLAITGDPLHSLHHTQKGAVRLERPRELDVALESGPRYLRFILHTPVVWGGLAGCVAGLWLLFARSILPAAVLAVGMLGFLGLGLADVPLLIRYYYVPASMLALFCAVAGFGWLHFARGTRVRRVWIAGALVLAAAAVWSLPRERERLETVRSASITRRGLEASLRELVQSPAGRAALRACPQLYVPDGRTAALVAYWLDEAPEVPIGTSSPPAGGAYLGAPPGDLPSLRDRAAHHHRPAAGAAGAVQARRRHGRLGALQGLLVLVARGAPGDAGVQRTDGGAALFRCRAVEHQHAVEVIELVLEHTCVSPGRLDPLRAALGVLRVENDRERPLDLDVDAGLAEREAAFEHASRAPRSPTPPPG